jgi:hypothetical protein
MPEIKRDYFLKSLLLIVEIEKNTRDVRTEYSNITKSEMHKISPNLWAISKILNARKIMWSEFHTEYPQIPGTTIQYFSRHGHNEPGICAALLRIIYKMWRPYFTTQYFDFVALCRHSVQEILCSSAFVVYARSTQGYSNCSEQQVAKRDEEVNHFHSGDGFSVNTK